jgi:excinuclease Cho
MMRTPSQGEPPDLDPLREAAAALPNSPGVYVFYGEGGGLPLYVGKSVAVRSRVQAHLRTTAEARMLSQTRRIICHSTAGELGALLLESALIKSLQPLYNQRLRRTRRLCAWRLETGALPELVDARAVDFSPGHGCERLYGLFATTQAAQAWLRELAAEHHLCLGVLGLERTGGAHRPCFRYQLKRCRGACVGQEPRVHHDERLHAAAQALALQVWPRPKALALIEQGPTGRAVHVVRQWRLLGTVSDLDQAQRMTQVVAEFDADLYKILVRPVLQVLAGYPDALPALWLD